MGCCRVRWACVGSDEECDLMLSQRRETRSASLGGIWKRWRSYIFFATAVLNLPIFYVRISSFVLLLHFVRFLGKVSALYQLPECFVSVGGVFW